MPDVGHYFLIFVFLTTTCGFFNGKKIARVDRLEICETTKDSPFIWDVVRLENIPRISTLVHLNMTVTKDVTRIQGLVILNRCSYREVLDSCEYFTSLRLTDLCSNLKKNGTAYTPFIYGFHPPFTCPFLKGQYKLINGSWDMTIFNFFPMGNFYWKVKLKIFDETFKKLYYVACGEGKCISLRNNI